MIAPKLVVKSNFRGHPEPRKWVHALPLLLAGMLLAACGTTHSSASTSPAQSASPVTSATSPALGQLEAAARQEGKLSIITAPGDVFRKTLDVFGQKYGISIDLITGNGQADIQPRVD